MEKPLQPVGIRRHEFCTTREAAEQLGVSLRTAQLWVDSGVLEAWKTEGGHRRISVASVERLLQTTLQGSAPEAQITARTAEDQAGRLRILVVEDDNTLLKLYRLRISTWGLPIDVTTAANGYDALLLVGREQPDLMVTDLNMPGIDGFQMVQNLINSSFREGMEIAIVTGMEPEDIEKHGGLPPGVQLFHKPVPFNELKAYVSTMLSRRAQLYRS